MKDPKDMTREELAEALADIEYPLFVEAARRLRNSIDRPRIEVDHKYDCAMLNVNGIVIVYDHTEVLARDYQLRLRSALGMEGGEG